MNGNGPPSTAWLHGPFLVGFEATRMLIERAARADSEGYPPFNIEELSEGSGKTFRIIIAVAGFAPEEISITLEGRELVVSGAKAESAERTYLHRGIATRRFRRVFALADGVEVHDAVYANGLISIDLTSVPHEQRIRTIPIRSGQNAAATKQPVQQAAE